MKPNKIASETLSAALLLGAVAAVPAHVSAGLVVDRGLPTANLNDAAGANRSNISWGGYQDANGAFWFTGDTFVMPDLPAGKQWTIDTIRIWSPAIPVGNTELGDVYDSIALYAGTFEDPRTTALPQRSSGNISGNTSSNPNIQFTRVYYNNDGVTNYQGNEDYQVWQVDFTHLGWVVDPLAFIDFGVDAMGSDFWYNHASNAALSGSPQQGSNGFFSQISADGFTIYDCDSGNPADVDFCPWDKSSDINVQVFANTVPVPGSLALALIGLFGLVAARRTSSRPPVIAQPHG